MILTNDHNIWIYNIYTHIWKNVPKFISTTDGVDKEFVVKIDQGRCTVALTNLGHVFNIPISLNISDSIKFVDISCGYDHTILLAENGDVYSIGMGT
jgi:alpha-tubulin suppressor-like RCC1 family protein